MKSLWRVWAKALGEKSSNNNKEADTIAAVRTIFVVLTILTEIHIIVNFYLTHM